MNERSEQELRRILELVEAGTITPEEGDRLVSSLDIRQQSCRCPYCAEEIALGLDRCPECASPLYTAPPPPAPRDDAGESGIRALGGLGKFLLLYTFLVTAVVILTGIMPPHSAASMCQVGLAGLGLFAVVLITRGNPAGFGLGALWGGLQIPLVIVNHAVVNRQLFTININWIVNGDGLGINLVGIVLLILFIKARNISIAPYQSPAVARPEYEGTLS